MECGNVSYYFATRVLIGKKVNLFFKIGQKVETVPTHTLGNDWYFTRVSLKKHALDEFKGQLQFGVALESTTKHNGIIYMDKVYELQVHETDTLVKVDIDCEPTYKNVQHEWRDWRIIATDLKEINRFPCEVALGPKILFGNMAVCLLNPIMGYMLRQHSKFHSIPKETVSQKFITYAEHYVEITRDAEEKQREEEEERIRIDAEKKQAKSKSRGFLRRISSYISKKFSSRKSEAVSIRSIV